MADTLASRSFWVKGLSSAAQRDSARNSRASAESESRGIEHGQRELAGFGGGHLMAGPLEHAAHQVGGGPRDLVQVDRSVLRGAAARHVQKGADDSAAALGGLADPLRIGLQVGQALAFFFEQAGAPHHDGQRIVQFMGNARQQAAHHTELFTLAQGFALAVDLGGGVGRRWHRTE